MPEYPQLIADPRNYGPYRSLQSIPGLTAAEQQEIKETLTHLIGEHLDTTKAWSRQAYGAVQTYMDKAMESLPVLTGYQSGWPARALGQAFLHRRCRVFPSTRSAHKGALIPPPGRQSSVRTIGDVPELKTSERVMFFRVMVEEAKHCLQLRLSWAQQSEHSKERFMKHMSARLGFLNRYENQWPAEHCVKKWLTSSGNLGRQSSKSPSVEVIISPVSRHSSKSRTKKPESATASSSSSVKAGSIRAVIPSISNDLLAILQDAGVETSTHLDALAHWPHEDQENFIKEDLELNKFQARMLRRILDERCEDNRD